LRFATTIKQLKFRINLAHN